MFMKGKLKDQAQNLICTQFCCQKRLWKFYRSGLGTSAVLKLSRKNTPVIFSKVNKIIINIYWLFLSSKYASGSHAHVTTKENMGFPWCFRNISPFRPCKYPWWWSDVACTQYKSTRLVSHKNMCDSQSFRPPKVGSIGRKRDVNFIYAHGKNTKKNKVSMVTVLCS